MNSSKRYSFSQVMAVVAVLVLLVSSFEFSFYSNESRIKYPNQFVNFKYPRDFTVLSSQEFDGKFGKINKLPLKEFTELFRGSTNFASVSYGMIFIGSSRGDSTFYTVASLEDLDHQSIIVPPYRKPWIEDIENWGSVEISFPPNFGLWLVWCLLTSISTMILIYFVLIPDDK